MSRIAYRRQTRHTAAQRGKGLLIGLGIALALVFTLWPPVWLFITSLKHTIEIFHWPPTFIPQNPTLGNYGIILTGRDPESNVSYPVLPAFVHSCIVALATATISTVVATCAAYSLARKRMRLMAGLFVAILVMRTIPRISIAIPLYLVIQQLGMLDTLQGLILTHITVVLPLATFLMYSFFQDLPDELEEAALVDGASRLRAFVRIVVPLVAPGIAVTAIIAFILSYNEFLYSLIVVSTQQSMTLPVALSGFILEYGIRWDLLSAAGFLAVIPIIVFSFFVQRHIVRGLSLGAVKG